MFETTDTKVCRGCLSPDRKLASVSTGDLILYYSLLAEDPKLNALTIPGMDLCWECVAMLRRTRKFRVQVQRAHKTLEESLGLPPVKATLSTLTIQHKSEYDAIFEDTKLIYKPLYCKTKVPEITVNKILIPTKYKSQVLEKAVESAKNFTDVRNVNVTKTNYKPDFETENTSDNDNDNYENFDASARDSSSPEISIKNITPVENDQDVEIIESSSIQYEKPKPECRESVSHKPISINKVVKSAAKHAPIIKTPVIAKLELELQKLMQNPKFLKNTERAVRQKAIYQKNRQKESTSTKNRSSNNTAEQKNYNSDRDGSNRDDSDSGSGTKDDTSNQDHKEYKRKSKRSDSESDPDFNLEEDEGNDSTSNHSKPGEDASKEDLTNEKKKTIRKRYRKVITRHKHIEDVLSCFTEIEMSVDELKSTLEKEDAIVDEKKPYDCSICGQRFQRHRTLAHHASQYHKATHRGQFIKGWYHNPPPFIPEKPCLWRCGVCTRMFRREHVLAHVNEYHRTRYFCNGEGCEWSQKGFWMKADHKEHWAAIHQQFSCDICDARKTQKSAIEAHIMRSHLRLPKQQCPHCPNSYVHSNALERHMQERHSEPEPAELRYCVECDRTFNSISSLQKHFYRHNEARKREKYPCPDCGRVLANKSNYTVHYKTIHAGKTDHCCHICGKYLSRPVTLRNHLKSHLNIKEPKTKPCTICGRMFQTNRILRHHMYIHTGERPYQCAHCDVAYTQPYCLRVHLAKAHGMSEVKHHVTLPKTTVANTENDQC